MSQPFNMPRQVREQILRFASSLGWLPVESAPGTDRFVKLITLSRKGHTLCIDKVTGISGSGEIKWLKVVVHPDKFRPEFATHIAGVKERLNRGENWHRHSGFQSFKHDGKGEPAGMAYEVSDLVALEQLLAALSGQPVQSTASERPATVSPEPQAVKIDSRTGTLPANLPRIQKSIVRESRTSRLPDRALIIDEPWISYLLSGRKSWEMRSTATHIRGAIGLIRKGSGQVVGVADLVDSRGPLDREEMLESIPRHCIDAPIINSGRVDKWCYAWEMANVVALRDAVPYQHKSGAVIWVEIDSAVGRQIAFQLDDKGYSE